MYRFSVASIFFITYHHSNAQKDLTEGIIRVFIYLILNLEYCFHLSTFCFTHRRMNPPTF